MPPRDGYRDYPGAPDLRRDFSRSPGDDAAEERPEGTPDPVELLDEHDLSTWDYTPGGTLEHDVHQQLSDAGRAAYRDRMRTVEKEDKEITDCERSLDELFEAAAAVQDTAYEDQQMTEEVGDQSPYQGEAQSVEGPSLGSSVEEEVSAQVIRELIEAEMAVDGYFEANSDHEEPDIEF